MIKTISFFASGNEVNFKECINFVETNTFLDFNKDVKYYGYSFQNTIDANFDKAKTLNITVLSDNILNGIIEFKSKNSNIKLKKQFTLHFGQNTLQFEVPKLSSKIEEITLYFPKRMNKFAADGTIPCIRFEKIKLM